MLSFCQLFHDYFLAVMIIIQRNMEEDMLNSCNKGETMIINDVNADIAFIALLAFARDFVNARTKSRAY